MVAGFCRSALEAACHEAIRARRLTAGVPHAEVERALTQAQTLHQVMALALFDSVARGSQVVPELRKNYGENAVNAFVTAKAGTHTAYRGDLAKLVRDVGRLARRLPAVTPYQLLERGGPGARLGGSRYRRPLAAGMRVADPART